MRFSSFYLLCLAGWVAGCTSTGGSISTTHLETRVGQLESRVAVLERHAGVAVPRLPGEGDKPEPSAAVEQPSPVLPLVDEPDVEEVLELPSVRQVQAALKSAGFYQGEVDGKMGPMTKGAIREFQRVNGLEVDGVMGIGTWRLLRKHAPSE